MTTPLIEVAAAGTIEAVHVPRSADLATVEIRWTSDASGNVDAWMFFPNIIDRIVIKPGPATPTTGFNLYLRDAPGADILNGQGEGIDSSGVTCVRPYIAGDAANRAGELFVPCRLHFVVSAAGNAKNCLMVFYMLAVPQAFAPLTFPPGIVGPLT